MASSVGNFALKQLGMEWVTSPDRMGYLAYSLTTMAYSKPLHYLVERQTQGMFSENAPEEKNPSLISQMGLKPVKTMDELSEKIFRIAVSLALFIPVTLLAKETIIYLGYKHLSMATTPLTTLLKDEIIDTLMFETLSMILCLSLDSSKVIA